MSTTARLRSLVAVVLTPALVLANASAQKAGPVAQTQNEWYVQSQATLQEMLALEPDMNEAKNVIIFIADGADPVSITATRILAGQQKGLDGEDNVLVYEAFPNVALVKTYTTDAQVADSAPTATAWNTGVKTNNGVIGVNDSVTYDDCASQEGNEVTTIFELAELAGMSTGTVSTARLTHATPAANYAHTASRDWEADSDLSEEAVANGCTDIAAQLLDFSYGDGLEVALGGGRTNFLPDTVADPEDPEEMGARADAQDLTQRWTEQYENAAYVWNQEQFSAVDAEATEHLLGLFEPSHMQYEADRESDTAGEPSLSEMTAKALEILSKNENGYLLQVESGRVDHALHAGNAYRALNDGVEFEKAIAMTLEQVNLEDTLVIVTSDHGHTLGFAGYPERGNPILGLVRAPNEETGESEIVVAQDGKPYTTLGFLNGPGSVYYATPNEDGTVPEGAGRAPQRPDLSDVDVEGLEYLQQAVVPLESETHGGTDIAAYATGPRSFLVRGVIEQNYLFQVMNYALNLTERAQAAGN